MYSSSHKCTILPNETSLEREINKLSNGTRFSANDKVTTEIPSTKKKVQFILFYFFDAWVCLKIKLWKIQAFYGTFKRLQKSNGFSHYDWLASTEMKLCYFVKEIVFLFNLTLGGLHDTRNVVIPERVYEADASWVTEPPSDSVTTDPRPQQRRTQFSWQQH